MPPRPLGSGFSAFLLYKVRPRARWYTTNMARVQTPEAQSFIQRVLGLPKGPGALLDPVLKPSLDDETELRRLFATDKTHARLSNPYVGLVDVFDAPADIRTTRARVVKDETDLSAKYVMPLSEVNRRKEGTPSIVSDIDEFKKNWGVFSEGSLSQLFDWNNVVAAGGSVLACLTPLSEEAKVSKRSMRKYYHSAAYPTSDVDLFLWGMTPEQAEVKITKIYEAVRDSVPWDVTCVRTKHTVSIHSQYPYRSVQIVLRLYSSPAEILAGFDIDAPCCAYDGNRVYANPRAIVAMMRQCNTVDMTRRSPSYEVRLAKYSGRAFEVYVPTLSRADIDPTIYERSIVRVTGLARLLVLEKLTNTDERFAFLESRRTLRGRPNPLNQYNRRQKRKFKGDLKGEANALSNLEMNDYDVASLHIPYGPGWDARRIDKLVYQTDLGMNSTFNPKNKGRRLHRHPAFFGNIEEVMEDCCENCPVPIDEDERKLQAEEDEGYIRGRISFVEEDPGRQTLSGSFNPIDVGEWSAQVYIGPTERFFAAIAAHDRAGVARMLGEGQDVNRRDHVGRAPLHVAIMCRAVDIACDLVDAGARMTARLVDGRTTLHLAAQQDLLPVVRKLLERSAINAEKIPKDAEEDKEAVDAKAERERLSSEDDWSSEDDGMSASDEEGDSEGNDGEGAKPKKAAAADRKSEPPTNVGDLPEDVADEPDVFDLNVTDWDMTFTALGHAIVFASLPVVEALLNAGSDVKHVSQAKGTSHAILPLSLTILSEDDERTCKIAERLIMAGASCSAADPSMSTIFDRAVIANRPNLVQTFLRCDPNGKAALNHLVPSWSGATSPLATAVNLRNYSVIVAMFAYGAKMAPSEEDVQRAFASSSNFSYVPDKQYVNPLETALAVHDDIFRLLVDLGGEFNVGVKRALASNSQTHERRTLVEWVQWALTELEGRIADFDKKLSPPEVSTSDVLPGWKGYVKTLENNVKISLAKSRKEQKTQSWEELARNRLIDVREYFTDMEKFLVERGAKSWSAVYPGNVSTASDPKINQFGSARLSMGIPRHMPDSDIKYVRLTGAFQQEPVPAFQNALYDELFEACFTGANDRIQELCLPAAKPNKDAALLQIAVAVTDGDGNRYSRSGLTPLFAAVCGRHWDTARLVLAIVAAQYKPVEKTGRFSTSNIDLDDESDNESDNSDDSDGTIEQDTINFVDIASRPSTVECNVQPKDILGAAHGFSDRDLIRKAVNDDDLEAFVNVLNLYKHSPKHVDLPNYVLEAIVQKDRVEMLDEYIRRTGSGIRIQTIAQDGDEIIPVVNDKNKVYLGLNVHGKKRTDLAKRNDPDASQQEEAVEFPLVWRAVSVSAKSILDYLQTDRPLAAYKFYASSNSSETALILRRKADLAKVLPEWLGWSITSVGESPLTVAIVTRKLDTVKYLFEKSPRLMASCLHERIKFLGVNSLMIAVQLGCDTDLVDFLLAKSVSPAQADQTRGWNIFHYMCDKNHHELLKHFLNKLPRDVVEALLAQQSKGRLNTPLHIAAKKGYKTAVKLIVEFSKTTALVRDVDGSIPLHSAVRAGFSETIQILVDAAPSGLHMENGVGEAPLEIAILQDLIARNQQLQSQNYGGRYSNNISELQLSVPDSPPRLDIDRLEIELPKFRITLDGLVANEILKKETKAVADMFAFAEHMEWKLVAAKAARNADSTVSHQETGDSAKALANVKAIMGVVEGHRELVHLVDVQTSVQSSLSKSSHQSESNVSYRRRRLGRARARDEEGLDPEDNSEEKELRGSYVYKHSLNAGPDTL
ncbi:Ankyrin repeat protein [Mycena venus]|uniref:Ankyrin repeat protein n=1 Tax=Mycena venus TaxID=2733690 RepID=A0A8H7CEH8_9AGAR|nr:Ankyrin repeat protein [Mycena venus]